MTTNGQIPLCVDLDGTLIAGDTLVEAILIAVKGNPLVLLLLPFWILKGRAYFKERIASRASINPEALPYRQEVLDFIMNEKNSGRDIILATATHQSIADSVSAYLGIFSSVIATNDPNVNLRGENKKNLLAKLYGEKGFDYAGDSIIDLPVWAAARNAIVVEPSNQLLNKAKKQANVNLVFKSKKSFLDTLVKEIRVHQWIKNILVFLPVLLAHRIFDSELILRSVLAFFAFSFSASFVYVTNDLLDLESDRQHPRKRFRPLASGSMTVKTALLVAPVLLILGLGLSIIFQPLAFTVSLVFYLVLTASYSFYLKKIYIIDIMVLAGLYTLRLIAGALSVNVIVSPWLLAFSMFIFLSLAVVKRYAELKLMKQNNKTHSKGRGYIIEDLPLLRNLGVTSGYLSALVLVLYVNSEEVVRLYKVPELLLPVAICLLFWITRIWFLSDRGRMDDDPIIFTAKDPVSYIVGLIVILLVLGAAIL